MNCTNHTHQLIYCSFCNECQTDSDKTKQNADCKPVLSSYIKKMDLTEKTLSEKLKEGDMVVLFYAPWCGYCKTLQPTYRKVAAAHKGPGIFAMVDCTAHPALGQRYEIKGFPTIFFHNGVKTIEFSGERTEAGLREFMTANIHVANKQQKKQRAPKWPITKRRVRRNWFLATAHRSGLLGKPLSRLTS